MQKWSVLLPAALTLISATGIIVMNWAVQRDFKFGTPSILAELRYLGFTRSRAQFDRDIQEANYCRIKHGDCKNCFLNSSCYNARVNPFVPSVCDAVRNSDCFDADGELCAAIRPPVLFIGDSRTRMLMGILSMMYKKAPTISCYVDQPLLDLRKKNESGWQDRLPFWRLKPNSTVFFDSFRLVADRFPFGKVFTLSMLWDPLMELPEERLVEEVRSMEGRLQDGFIVFHLGAWLQKNWSNMTEMSRLEENVNRRIESLRKIAQERNARIICLLDPHTDLHPIWFPSKRLAGFSRSSIADWTISLTTRYPEVLVWDAHISATEAYREICVRESVPTSRRVAELPRTPCYFGEHNHWMCYDLMHPGGLVMQRWAKMLLAHMCQIRRSMRAMQQVN